MTSKFKKNMRRSLDKRLKKGGANALTVFTLLFVFILFCGITSGDMQRTVFDDALGLLSGMAIASAFGFYWGFFNVKSNNYSSNSRRDDSSSHRWGANHRHSTTSSSIFTSSHSSMNSTSSYSNPTNYSWSSNSSANYHRR